ncbi:glutamate--tRNA ligase [Candidatus Gottesmanbacteria bacterium RBG_13_37_7]|uniref:Glutamate--tRNA ligase n=1 Tax=Candidatus Gottesmanbacteria bacterium RBG_13_37_7 TaxID=1798369 RepID=A0A1F5YJ80_9BACT|nr:MAG: glutamate--tRNA ligase [Candidatus Gottesmanbacteria bacterium RBG_13_37_7]
MNQVRVRIAPSPTGEDLHIGNVYTALLNYIFAKKNKGKFILRIEDTDRGRLVEGSVNRILDSLKWFGLEPDESLQKGGPYGPYLQSERIELYRHYAEELVKKDHAYYCVCTPDRLEAMRQEQKVRGLPTIYDGRCKKIQNSIRQLADKVPNKKYVIRLNVPDEGKTEFNDLIRGKISFENKLIDDQVLIKSDGYPTYHLAVVVDDYLMKISHVIRAEEWISSVPKHILIYKFLGWELPVFAHGPILRNPDKSKLSKRKNPVWASWYRQEGYLPDAILNYLALMGWSMSDNREIFSLAEMIDNFRLEDIKPVGPAFDIKKLEWMNGEYIRKTQNSALKTQIYNFLEKKYPENIIEKTIPLVRERIKKLSDYLPLAGFFFDQPKSYELDMVKNINIIKQMVNKLDSIKKWNADDIGKAMMTLCKKSGIKTGDFFMIARVAATGKKISPPLNESMEIMGKDEVLARLRKIL